MQRLEEGFVQLLLFDQGAVVFQVRAEEECEILLANLSLMIIIIDY